MGLTRHVIEEGLRIPPLKVVSGGQRQHDVWALLLANVQLPDDANPRTRELAQQLRAEAASDESYIAAVLRMFNDEAFYAVAFWSTAPARSARAIPSPVATAGFVVEE